MNTHLKVAFNTDIKHLNNYFLVDYSLIIKKSLHEENKIHIDYFKQLLNVLNNFPKCKSFDSGIHPIVQKQYIRSESNQLQNEFHSFYFLDNNNELKSLNCFYGELFKEHIQKLKTVNKENISHFNNGSFSLDIIFASLSSDSPFDTLQTYIQFKQQQQILHFKNTIKWMIDSLESYFFHSTIDDFLSFFDLIFGNTQRLLNLDYFHNFKFHLEELRFLSKNKEKYEKLDFINCIYRILNSLD